MNKKISDWASIAEIVSGIAVVITLVFLIFGIKENSGLTRASMYQRSTDRIIEWRNHAINDPEVAELLQAFIDNDYDGISGVRETRLRQMVLNLFQLYEQTYFAEQYGLLGPAEWGRFQRQICLFRTRVQNFPAVEVNVAAVMTQEFSEYMEVSCQE